MACIERRPRCGEIAVQEEPISKVVVIVGGIVTIIGLIVKFESVKSAAESAASYLGGMYFAGATAGFIGAVAVLATISWYVHDRCNPKQGESVCLAGVVQNIVQDFNDFWDDLLPFSAMHDRVDLVVKSRFWDIVENNATLVHCTDVPIDSLRKSEIFRAYYFTDRVCNAARGAMVGGSVGAVPGILLAALAAAAIGCITFFGCLLALLVAALIAATMVLAGAWAGGHIAKGEESSPEDDSGTSISIGDLLRVSGPIFSKEYDNGANVMWWVDTSALSGNVYDRVPNNPFSYCEIDEEFMMDGCPRVIPPIE
jgi:hypothetical protein